MMYFNPLPRCRCIDKSVGRWHGTLCGEGDMQARGDFEESDIRMDGEVVEWPLRPRSDALLAICEPAVME